MLTDESISHERANDHVIMRWRGDVDLAVTPMMQSKTLAAVRNTDSGLVLDLSAVTYIDSAGLRSLIRMRILLEARQQRLVLVLPEESTLQRTIQIGGVPRMVPTYGTLEEATAAIEE